MPNVLVYVPNATVAAFTPGVQCLQSGAPVSGSPLVSTYTAVDGTFTLTNVPVGTNIPLVIQAGKWRRQVIIPTVTACVSNSFSTRMPQNQSEGDIPLIAVSTGSVDALECVLRRTGIADSEFTDPGGSGRVQFFKGSGSAGSKIDNSTPSESTLVSSPSTLSNYDMVMFPCQGGQYDQTSTNQTNLINYANAGGRVFATHFSYVWLYNDSPFSTVADWHVNQSQLSDGTATINTSFTGGATLAQWLLNAGASSTYGQIDISTLRHDQDGVVAPTQTWLNLNDSGAGNPSMQFTFNTPVGADAGSQCGRVLFNEYHVENASTGGTTFPNECPSLSTPMTAQEKMLEYALFDLSNFVTPVVTPTVGVTVSHSPSTYTEGDTGDNVTVNVSNTSSSVPLSSSIVLTVALPTGVTATAMTDVGGGWNCTVSTLTCTRSTTLAPSTTDSISITTNVAGNAPVGTFPATGTVSGGGLSSNVTGTDNIPIIGAPVVTWAAPAAITYGTAVSGTQLDAVGNTTGPIVYTYASGPHAGQVLSSGTVLDAGSYPLTATFTPTDQVHYPGTATANVTLVVNPAPQVIHFTAPSTALYGTPVTLSATGGASGNPVTFSIVSGPGTITSGNVLTMTGIGTVVVAADQAGNTDYTAATTVTQSVTCNQLPQVITFNPASPVDLGVPPITLSATGGASGNPVTFSIVSGPGTISGNTLTVTGGGAIVIAANQAGNTLYAPAPTVTGTILVRADCDTAPKVPVGNTSDTQTATVHIHNDLDLDSVHVGVFGEEGKDYSVVSGGTCVPGHSYSAGDDCTVNYTFHPTTAGQCQGNVTLNDSTGHIKETIGIKGEGDAPQMSFSHGKQKDVADNLNYPEGVAVDSHGNVYHTVVGGSQVIKESFDGTNYTPSVVVNSGLNGPYGVAIDCRGNLYVADEDNNQVVKETWDGDHYTPTVVDSDLSHPNGVAVDCPGNVYVADSGNSRVFKEKPDGSGGYTRELIADSGSSNLKGPQGVAVDGDGCVYIADTFSNRILKETPKSGGGYDESEVPTSGVGHPLGVSVDRNRNVYISDSDNNRVLKESKQSDGSYNEREIDTDGLTSPHGVATDEKGNVFVCDAPNDRIVKVDVSDAPEVDFSSSAVGQQSKEGEQKVKITNDGTEDLVFPVPSSGNNPNLSDSDFTFDHSSSDSCPSVSSSDHSAGHLAPGASCTVSVSCTPTSHGALSGSLDLTENDLNGSGDEHHIALTGNGVDAGSTTTVVTSSLNPSNKGQSVSFTATIAPVNGSSVPTGTVQFSVDGTPAGSAVSLVSGVATYTTSALAQGTRNITAVYTPTGGSGFLTSTSAALSQVVNYDSSITLQFGLTHLIYPGTTNVNACISPATSATPTGTVQIYDGTSLLSTQNVQGSGCAYWTISPGLTAGQHTFTAFYSGDSHNAPGTSSPTILYVNPVAVNVALSPSNWSPTYGSTVTLTASVTAPGASAPNADGSVTFSDGATVLGNVAVNSNGQASYSTNTLTGGSHTITANYGSASNYAPGSATATFTVSAANQTISFTGLPSTATFGSAGPYSLSATATSGLPVSFSVTGPASISGTTLTITGAGSVAVSANQAGNGNYNAAATVTQYITVSHESQSISFTAPSTPVNFGHSPISLSASATSGLAITFNVLSGPASISGSTLTFTGAGTVVVAADQYGSIDYAAATEVTHTIVVNHASSSVALVSNSNPVLVQDAITLTATVTSGAGTPTGQVNFLDGSTSIGTAWVNGSGVASLTISTLAVGTHSITAAYAGDSNYSAATSSAVSEVVDDFNLSVPVTGGSVSTPTITSQPGGVAVFTFTMSPVGSSTFLHDVVLTASGLPAGATYVFSPATITAGSGSTSVTLTVTLPQTGELVLPGFGNQSGGTVMASNTSKLSTGGTLAAFALAALVLLPFANKARKSRKLLGRLMSLLLLFAALGSVVGLSGCGVSSMPSYNVTVTATSGALVRTTGFTLKVE